MTPVAAIIRGHDNDTYMVGSCEKRLPNVPDSVFCPACGWKVDWQYVRPDYRLGRRKRDVSATYDGATIVSQRAREILCGHGIERMLFTQLPHDPDFFTLAPDMVVNFDSARRKTRLENLCEKCGLYAMVAGATPAFFYSLPKGDAWIARTDLLFGSYNEHHPLIVVSDRIAQALRSARLTGLDLEVIQAEQVADGNPTSPSVFDAHT